MQQFNTWLDLFSNWPVFVVLAILAIVQLFLFNRRLTFYDGFVITYVLYYTLLSDQFHFQHDSTPWFAVAYYCIVFGVPVVKVTLKRTDKTGDPYLLKDDPLRLEDYENEGEVIDREQLSGHIVSALKLVSPDRAAFVVGIEGEWGAGKSSFLLQLTKNFGAEHFDVMRFNPWYFADFDSLLKDFMEQLGNKLKTSQGAFDHYRRLLQASEAGFFGTSFLNRLIGEDDSVEDAKDTISSQLILRKKPLIIMIDEIDRLQKEELYNLLRLIRVIADFKNIIYIVFYDKQ
ncbi:MAG: P-loop NTPase fold protein, partial [Imperialibacter sp.]